MLMSTAGVIVSVNTYIGSCVGAPATFGGRTGGMVVNAYLPWIDSIVECAGNCDDCNGNGVPDECDIADGTSLDEDGNGIPDECQVDCNNNGLDDATDIATGTVHVMLEEDNYYERRAGLSSKLQEAQAEAEAELAEVATDIRQYVIHLLDHNVDVLAVRASVFIACLDGNRVRAHRV